MSFSRSRTEIESIALFVKLKAYADDVEIDRRYNTGIDILDEDILQKFPLKSLDLDKLMTHMLDCASALYRVDRLQKEDGASGNVKQQLRTNKRHGRASYRRLFSFALQETLSAFVKEDEIAHSSTPAAEHLLHAYPAIPEEREDHNWLPLHWAAVATAAGGTTAEVGRAEAKLLYTESNGSLRERHLPSRVWSRFFWETFPGYTPLHLLCMSPKPDLELLKYFAGGNPAAFIIIAENVNYGYCPLHAAAQYCNSVEALQLLIQTSPQLVRENENGDYTCYPLDVLISNYSESEQRTAFSDMLKHLLGVSKTVPVIGKAVCALMELLSTTTSSTRKNLNATSREYVFGLMEELLKKYPSLAAEYRGGSRENNAHGPTLLLYATITRFAHDEDCMRLLQLLVNAAPEHITTAGIASYSGIGLPVHAAAIYHNLASLKYLLELRPETWISTSSRGLNLLHCAVNSLNQYKGENLHLFRNKIKYILEHHPELQYQRNESGETPLIYLIKAYGAPVSHVISLFLNTETVKMPLLSPDPTAEFHMALPLHIYLDYCLHHTNEKVYELTVKRLLYMYLEAAGIRDAKNHTPYDVAKAEDCPNEIPRLLLRAYPDQDPQALRDLNWEARKMGVWLGSYRAIAIGETLNIMARLRMVDTENRDLLRHIVSFL